MCELVERKDFILEKEKAEDCILKTYDLFKLKRPTKIVWLKDIFDKKWIDITKSVGSAGSAWSARSAWSAWSALDYDFDWFVIEHEYIKNRKDNQGEEPTNDDKIYLEYSELLMEAIECGLGYRIEFEDTLYLIPTSLVLIDEQNRFHSTKEPSIKWKDGKELYYLHGINFEKEWWNKIVNDKMTPEEIFAIDNLEHRRIAYEYMDKTKMRLLKDYKILDEIKDDGYGYAMKVISFSIKGIDEPLKYLNVFCPSTGREYFIGTNENNCLEAKSKSFGLDKDTEFIKEW
jgi:hypothetical protein